MGNKETEVMLSHGPRALKAWSEHTAWEKENSTPKLALNQTKQNEKQHTLGLTFGHTLEPEIGHISFSESCHRPGVIKAQSQGFSILLSLVPTATTQRARPQY